MKKQNLQEIFFIPELRNENELVVLQNYNNYLMQQIDDMRLHPLHKEDVKAVILQALAEARDNSQNTKMQPKSQSWLLRILQKTAR